MIRIFTTALLFFFFCINSYSQILNQELIYKQLPGSFQSWIKSESNDPIYANNFFQNYKTQLGLGDHDEMILQRAEEESNASNHMRFQQFYKGIKVLSAEYIIHEKNSLVTSANGRVLQNIDVPILPKLTSEEAIQRAIIIDDATHYYWHEVPQAYPKAELLIMDRSFPEIGGGYVLAYKLDLFSTAPIKKTRYYIDAISGEVILSHETLMSCFGGNGSAHTLYHGLQNIQTLENNGEYILQDVTRGGGITTQSAKGTQYSDSDNSWESASFTQQVGALDLHYGAQSVYDFYKSVFNRDGIDGKNGRILCKVIDTTLYVNAFWESSTNTANFGIGDTIDTGPLTSLDVVGHELTHGLTQHTCGLEYLYEAGALNEALSDIIGKAVEYKNDPANYDWLIGSKFFYKPDTAFRSMSNPNRFKNPALFKGRHWNSGASDNGGVHTNSGVLNYWFYLLVTGQSGTNEAGKSFDVKRMGFDTTINIVYQMMKNYLISTSYYYDAREASLQIAEGLYGACSPEYINIAEAWRAVGLGTGVTEGDLLLSNYKIPQVACKEGLFNVEVNLLNQSCAEIIPAGSEIDLSISVKQKNKIEETLILTDDLLPGQSITYKFQSPAKIDKTATLVTVEAILINDADTSNNRFTISITKNTNSDHDFRVNDVNLSGSPCENNNLQANVRAVYNGCSPIPAGTFLDIVMKYDNEIISKQVKTQTTIYPNAGFRTPNFTVDRNFAGYKNILVALDYLLDTVDNNNITNFNAVYINNSELGYLEVFESNVFDSTLLAIKTGTSNQIALQANTNNEAGIISTGSTIYDSLGNFIPTNSSVFAGFFNGNINYTSTIYLCIDTKDLSKAYLSFDYIQKLGETIYDSLLVSPHFAVGTRVVFRNDRGSTIGNPYYLENGSKDVTQHHFEQELPLTGGPISIEITNLALDGKMDNNVIDLNKDYVWMDNIRIHAETVSNDQTDNNLVSVFPNPFSDELNFNIAGGNLNGSYALYNSMGIVMSSGLLKSQQNLNTKYLIAGNYILKLQSAEQVRLFKLTKI